MTVLRAHFDGKHIVLDDPAPADLAPNTQVHVVIGNGDARDVLAEISRLAVRGHLPPDFSQQHEHYVKGAPRREQAGFRALLREAAPD